MSKIALIGFAGLIGTVARYWLSGWVAQRFGETFPSGTLVVNLSGCFLVGFLFQLTEERFLVQPALRTALLIGLLGGYTTFSSFAMQTLTLLRGGEWMLATVNVLISNVLGLILVWAGYSLSKAL